MAAGGGSKAIVAAFLANLGAGVKIVFDGKLATAELAMAINDAERKVREVVPIARPMYSEPDIHSKGPAEEGN